MTYQQRKQAVAEFEATIKNEFPEVESVRLAGVRSRSLVAWSKNTCVLAEESGRTIEQAATNLCTALGYRRERNAEMEAQRVLFAAAVRS